MPPAPRTLLLSGLGLVAASVTLAITQSRLGNAQFFAIAAVLVACHAAALLTCLRRPPARRWLVFVFACALACRLPLMVGPVNYDSDMIRYVWDGRVQRFGYNPYALVPSDPALAHTHNADSARMPSRHDRTPYPPAAQLFFRLMVTVHESPRVMKSVLTLFEIATIFIVWRLLRRWGIDDWWILAYAWNPLVILEVAHSGHLDALGAFWIAAAALLMTRGSHGAGAAAYALAVATKLLPVVLAPIFLGRLRLRHIATGLGLLALLYLPYSGGGSAPAGAVPNVVAHIRFNSPIFRPLAWVVTPSGAAAFALAAGLGTALWMRRSRTLADPASWAWPMAAALACAPVIYPWYLLYLTPFLTTAATLPLTVWTYSVLPVYLIWEWAQYGARWRVPNWLMALEYGVVLAALLVLGWRSRQRPPRDAE